MKTSKELKEQIEIAREKLDNALSNSKEVLDCYDLSLKLDQLIEEYLDLQEPEHPSQQEETD
ncbi:MAG: hypothetical protein RR364_03905 [Lachnospiraceae bacterium]